MRDQQRPTFPGALDRWLPAALAVVGAMLLFAGYWGASGSTDPGEQLPHIASATIPGAVLVIAAAVLSLRQEAARAREESAAVGARLDALVEWLVTASTDPAPSSTATDDSNAGDSNAGDSNAGDSNTGDSNAGGQIVRSR